MCTIDYDPPSMTSTIEPTARILHRCDECGRGICPGEKYRRTFGVWERVPQTFRTCAHCCVGQDWLLENCNGYMHAGLLGEMDEHADEYPAVRFSMNRIRIGIRRGWQRFDRLGLMPVPKSPPEITEHTL